MSIFFSDNKKQPKNIFGQKGYAERGFLRQLFSKMSSDKYSKPERKTLEKKLFPERQFGKYVDKKEYDKAVSGWQRKQSQATMLGREKEKSEAAENLRILKKAAGIK